MPTAAAAHAVAGMKTTTAVLASTAYGDTSRCPPKRSPRLRQVVRPVVEHQFEAPREEDGVRPWV